MRVYFFSLGFATGLQGECVYIEASKNACGAVFNICCCHLSSVAGRSLVYVAESSAALVDKSVCEVIR